MTDVEKKMFGYRFLVCGSQDPEKRMVEVEEIESWSNRLNAERCSVSYYMRIAVEQFMKTVFQFHNWTRWSPEDNAPTESELNVKTPGGDVFPICSEFWSVKRHLLFPKVERTKEELFLLRGAFLHGVAISQEGALIEAIQQDRKQREVNCG